MIKSTTPIPNKTPVINLLALFDNINNINCIPPSITINKHNTTHSHIGNIVFKEKSIRDITYPTIIPVHRLHIGN